MDYADVILYVCCFLAFIAWICNKRPNNFPPGPYGLPLVGYLPFLGKHPYKTLRDLGKKYGNPYSLLMGTSHVIVLNDWKSMKEALIRNNESFNGRPKNVLFEKFFRYSDIAFSDGPGWKERKRFTLHRLKDLGLGKSAMENIIMDEIYTVIEDMKTLVHKSIDLHGYFFFPFLNLTWTIIGGKKFNDDDNFKNEVTHFLKDIVGNFTATNAALHIPAMRYLPNKNYNDVMDICQKMNYFFNIEIDEHVSTYQKGNQRDLIDTFLEEVYRREATDDKNSSFNRISLLETIKDLFAAGVETTNTTLMWSLLYMATWPEIQQKVQRQLDEVVGRERMPSYQDRLQLPYVEAVQLEIYRYSSIVALSVLHSTTSTVKLFDYIIPKGTTVIQNIWAVHHDPDYWGDPDVFRPERFLNEKGQVQKPEYLIPFSVGGRACLGESMAKMTSFLVLSCLLHKFTFSLVPGKRPPSLEPIYMSSIRPQRFSLIVTER